jgi:methyltransferase (TIGR00027 family)
VFKITNNTSKTAETVAVVRMTESKKPENERICYDPYAIRFISQDVLDFAEKNPEEYRAFVARNESLVPGASNSLVARVRYFDDVVKSCINNGLEQLVIVGAGYDTRAYRIEGMDKIHVFEIDHLSTQKIKINNIKQIFDSQPNHVTYIPLNLEIDDFGKKLLETEYDSSKKTLFIMEGLLMYISPETVDKILSFIVHSSAKESYVLFDYIPSSVVDCTCELEAGQNWQKGVTAAGEPFKFGISEGSIESFLTQRGFKMIRNMTSEDYKKAYFHGTNENRKVNKLLLFAYAVVE